MQFYIDNSAATEASINKHDGNNAVVTGCRPVNDQQKDRVIYYNDIYIYIYIYIIKIEVEGLNNCIIFTSVNL